MKLYNPYSKYHTAQKEDRTLDGILFASKLEMTRYGQLKLLQNGEQIKRLELQPRFVIARGIQGHRTAYYVADFKYFDCKTSTEVVEEVKGYETQIYRLKAHLFKLNYPEFDFRVLFPEDIL